MWVGVWRRIRRGVAVGGKGRHGRRKSMRSFDLMSRTIGLFVFGRSHVGRKKGPWDLEI